MVEEKTETRGRKLKGKSPRLKRSMNIDTSDFELLKNIGNGSASEGAHMLASLIRKNPTLIEEIERLKSEGANAQ